MMYVEGVDGTPISVVASFSLHYVGTGNVGEVSADYFGQFFNLMRHYLGGELCADFVECGVWTD